MGFDRPPAPCSEAGNAVTGGAQDGAPPGGATLPSFVPPRFRDTLIDAAAKWNVSAALLAAQLMAESNFNPFAVSPAGAEGIAQFMPGPPPPTASPTPSTRSKRSTPRPT